MKTYQDIKKDYQDALNNAVEKNGVFYAFNDKQLQEGKAKHQVKDNSELMAIGGGGFIKKVNLDTFLADTDKAGKDYRKELKQAKAEKEQAILYELRNFEAFYTGRIEETVDCFKGIYTTKDIIAVYNKFKNHQFAV